MSFEDKVRDSRSRSFPTREDIAQREAERNEALTRLRQSQTDETWSIASRITQQLRAMTAPFDGKAVPTLPSNTHAAGKMIQRFMGSSGKQRLGEAIGFWDMHSKALFEREVYGSTEETRHELRLGETGVVLFGGSFSQDGGDRDTLVRGCGTWESGTFFGSPRRIDEIQTGLANLVARFNLEY